MSGLIFKGDIVSSAGEYLPAPYINKITVTADAAGSSNSVYTSEIYIFVDDYEYVNVFENGTMQSSKEAYRDSLNKLNYYVMAFSAIEKEVYDSIITGDLNPLKFYSDFESDAYSGSHAAMLQIEALGGEPSEIYDEEGNRILVYPTEISSEDLDFESKGNNIEHLICFCSVFNYSQDSDSLRDDTYSASLLDIQTGDISYEKIYESFDSEELALQDTLKFYDSQDIIYDKIPLSSIERSVYKINLITHDDIKESINSLLDEYSDLYNEETGYENLKSEMNSIYSVLALHGDEYDIVHKLDEVRRNFSDKTPIKPVGKLYKRFAKRLFEINSSVVQSEILSKKITYNSKLIDFRTTAAGDVQTSKSENETYIYTDSNLFSNISIDEDTKRIVAGYFMFDYEKSLRRNSVLSQYIDINKLEMLGLNIPYEAYYLDNISLNYKDASIVGVFEENYEYPYVNKIRFVKDNDEFLDAGFLEGSSDINDSGFYGYDSPSTKQEAASNGYATSIINRSYAYYPSDEFEIENYRLMLFEVLEYRNDSIDDSYNIIVNIEDNTASYFAQMLEMFQEFYDDFVDYCEKANEACAFNHNLNKFNQYFIQSLLANYTQDSDATWYSAPSIYCLYADVIYNLFNGDLEDIEKEAKTIASAINPYTGDIDSINTFKEKMKDLLDAIGDISEQIPTESSTKKEIEASITLFEAQTSPEVTEIIKVIGDETISLPGDAGEVQEEITTEREENYPS